MHTVFRIEDTQTKLQSRPVKLNARELAKLRVVLQSAGGSIDLDDGEVEGVAFNFEQNANAIPLARFASIFDGRDDILAVVDEAQFLGRALRVTRAQDGALATVHVSKHIALSPEIRLSSQQAATVLECLDHDPAGDRTIPLDRLRAALQDVTALRRFDEAGVGYIHDYLARLAGTDCGEQQPHLTWA